MYWQCAPRRVASFSSIVEKLASSGGSERDEEAILSCAWFGVVILVVVARQMVCIVMRREARLRLLTLMRRTFQSLGRAALASRGGYAILTSSASLISTVWLPSFHSI